MYSFQKHNGLDNENENLIPGRLIQTLMEKNAQYQ